MSSNRLLFLGSLVNRAFQNRVVAKFIVILLSREKRINEKIYKPPVCNDWWLVFLKNNVDNHLEYYYNYS